MDEDRDNDITTAEQWKQEEVACFEEELINNLDVIIDIQQLIQKQNGNLKIYLILYLVFQNI